MKTLVKIEFFWDDLTKKKQDEIRKVLHMDEDDNGNWDVIPMGIMEVEFDEEEAVMSKDQATKKIIFDNLDDFTPDDIHELFDAIFGPLDVDKKDKDDQEAKADAGKARLSLVPQAIIYDIARIREYGNAKYPEGGRDNWKGVEKQRYVDAMLRHISAYISDPEGVDEESGFPHLWHAACNLAFILEMEEDKYYELLYGTRKTKPFEKGKSTE